MEAEIVVYRDSQGEFVRAHLYVDDVRIQIVESPSGLEWIQEIAWRINRV